ncbi:MAG TPA: ABC transporter substrate-binding protein [Candidatus Faecivicinus avistercoris]|nr:ABC transporter substrate-binding protein [Candidatus Faecivicinus avistercoris]
MKTFTRFLSALLIALLLVPTALVALAETAEPTELIFYFLGEELEDDKVVIEAINEKLIEKLNCYMTVEYIPFGEVNTTYPLLFASQTRMDAVFSASFTGYASLARRDAYMELTDEMLQTYAPLTWEDTPDSVWNQARVDGKIYAIPQLMIQNIQATIGIRGDLREKYDLPEITDIESLENYMSVISENEDSVVPLLFGSMWTYLYDLLMFTPNEWQSDANFSQLCMAYDITDPAPTPFCYLYTDEYRQALDTVYRWNQNGWISRDSLSNTHTNRENMANGRIAVMLDNAGTINSAGQDLLSGGSGAYLELIDISGDAQLLRYAATSGMLSIPSQSQHPELVLQVVDYLRNDKEMNYLVERGIEGEDAQWVFAGELNEDGTLNENVISYGARSSMYGGNWICWSAFRNWDYQVMESEASSIPGYREAFFDMDSRSMDHIMQAFTFDSTNYQNELAAIQSVYDEYGKPLNLGFVDPATGLDEYIAMMEAAGLTTVMDAYLQQAADYLAAQGVSAEATAE